MSTQAQIGHRRSEATTGITLTVLAALSFAASGFIAKGLIDDGVPGIIVAFYEGAFGLSLVAVTNWRNFRNGASVASAALPWMLIAGLSFAVGVGSFYTSLSRLEFSTGAPIVGAVPLASYLFVLLLLRGHERITRRALVGAVFVVAGVGAVGASA